MVKRIWIHVEEKSRCSLLLFLEANSKMVIGRSKIPLENEKKRCSREGLLLKESAVFLT